MHRLRIDVFSGDYTVGWISALPINALDERHCDPRTDNQNTERYIFGRIGYHNVVAVCLSDQIGSPFTSDLVAQLTATFPSIDFFVLVGIGGGVPGTTEDIRLGDVVIGSKDLVQFDLGKGGVSKRGHINRPPKALLESISKLQANQSLGASNCSPQISALSSSQGSHRTVAGVDSLYHAEYHHEGGDSCRNCDPDMIVDRSERPSSQRMIHLGTIAVGNDPMPDGVTRDKISKELEGVLCFETQAAGLTSSFNGVVIRGISNYADSHKYLNWESYAAAAAEAAAKELLLLIPATGTTRAVRGTARATRRAANTAMRVLRQSDEAVAQKRSYLYYAIISILVLLVALLTSTRMSPEAGPSPADFRIPFSLKGVPIGPFADRPQEMEQLEQTLIQNSTLGNRRKVLVLHGLGGIGKTQLAVEFARKNREAFTSVFWLDGSTQGSLTQSMAHSMSRIRQAEASYIDTEQPPGETQAGVDAAVHGFLDWLTITKNKNWLVIFDNVDREYEPDQKDTELDAYDIMQYLPNVDHGSVLITTRLGNLQHLGPNLHLRSVSIEQSLAIFQKWYNQEFALDDSKELLGLLNGLPLALAQAAAYMTESGAGFGTYTRLYKEQWKRLMDTKQLALLINYRNHSTGTTWMISYNAVRAKNAAAADLLLLWSHLDNKSLPFWMLQAGARIIKLESAVPEFPSLFEDINLTNELDFLKMIRLLQRYGLVQSFQGDSGHSVHPVVHLWAFHTQTDFEKHIWSVLAMRFIEVIIKKYRDKPDYYRLRKQIMSHFGAWTERLDELEDMPAILSELDAESLFEVAELLIDQGTVDSMRRAEKLLRKAVNLYFDYEYMLQEHNQLTLDMVHALGKVYTSFGMFEKAEKLWMHALETREDARTLDKPAIWGVVMHIANLYYQQGRVNEAVMAYQQLLDYQMDALGPEDLSTINSQYHLGQLQVRQGKLEDADTLLQTALEGYEKLWKPEHPEFSNILSSMGAIYEHKDQLKLSEAMHQRALDHNGKFLGENHLSTLENAYTLCQFYGKHKELEKADKMYQRLFHGYEQAVGPDVFVSYVPAIVASYSYGELLESEGRSNEARSMYMRALNGYEKAFGTENKGYKTTRERLKGIENAP